MWNDYMKVTEVDKYSQSRLLSLFRQFLSPDMKQTLTHVLTIKQDAMDTAAEVIVKTSSAYTYVINEMSRVTWSVWSTENSKLTNR